MGDNVPAGPVASWKLPNAGDSDSDRVNELLLSLLACFDESFSCYL